MSCDFRQLQRALTQAIRNQGDYTPPCGNPIEARRVKVYRDLFLNTVSQFFANVYPVCHAVLGEVRWAELMRAFLREHGAHTPYFHHLGREWLDFLNSPAYQAENDPPWLKQLADWEWQEVAVSTAAETVAAPAPRPITAETVVLLNPTARICTYDWPVHQAAPDTTLTPQQTFLLIWRDAEDETHFAALAPLMAALLAQLDGQTPLSRYFELLGSQCQQVPEHLFAMAQPFLQQLFDQHALNFNV